MSDRTLLGGGLAGLLSLPLVAGALLTVGCSSACSRSPPSQRWSSGQPTRPPPRRARTVSAVASPTTTPTQSVRSVAPSS